MQIVSQVQSWLLLGLGVALLAVEAFAFIEALRGSAVMFRAHGKLTKPAWCAITGVATVLGFIAVFNPLNIAGIIAIVAAGVFLADVRPLVRPGTRSNDGPYGPW